MRLIRYLLVACLLATPFIARAAEHEDPENQIDPVPVGDLEVLAMIDSRGEAKESLIPGLAQHPEFRPLFARGPLPAVTKTYFLKKDGHNILFDAGWGADLGKKGKTLELLAQKGINPAEITDVVLTHMDPDHIGGMLREGKPVFPNATVWIAKPELDAWLDGNISDRPATAKEFAGEVAAVYRDRIRPFNFGQEILPGIVALDASGHTPGHTAYEIKSGDQGLLVLGDLIHVGQIQFARPELSSTYDMNPEEAAKTRKKLLEYAADKGLRGAGMHFERVSPVRRTDSGFAIMEPR